jgi:L-fuculose-phosphate aldolase
MTQLALRQEIVEVGRRMWQRGYVAANDGNISVRLEDGSLLVTPTGVSKGFMAPDSILRLDAHGNVVSGGGRITTEVQMHLAVYKECPEIRTVVHAHPPYATTFAAAELPLERPILPEIVLFLDKVPLAPYATPSTDEMGKSLHGLIPQYKAILLSHHGLITMGQTLMEAYFQLERVENYAQVVFNLMMMDRVRELSAEAVEKLKKL